MDCDTCREALSARIDGEPEPVSPDDHLLLCTDCREWEAAATTLTWATWLPDLPEAPDATAAVLDRSTR